MNNKRCTITGSVFTDSVFLSQQKINKMVYTMEDSTKIAFYLPHFEGLSSEHLVDVFHTNRSIKEVPGLSWSLRVYRDYGPSVTVKIGVSVDSVKATGRVIVDKLVKKFDVTFDDANEQTIGKQICVYNGPEQFSVTVDVKLEIPECVFRFKPQKLNVFDLVADSQDDPDVEFRFIDGKVKVHRSFLSMISPVFQAMFNHDTKETKTGVVNVIDFDMKTVERVVNLCYGLDLETDSIPEIVDMLLFADKYDIKAVVKKLEAIFETSLDNDNFCAIAQYAFDIDRDNLKTVCGKYYRNNHGLSITPEFAQMSGSVQLGVIAAAASVNSPDAEQK